MTTVDDLRTLYEARLYGPEVPADVIHGVHIECQADAPFYVSRCGLVMEDSGHTDAASADPYVTLRACPNCNAASVCPVCGTHLPHNVTDILSNANWD